MPLAAAFEDDDMYQEPIKKVAKRGRGRALERDRIIADRIGSRLRKHSHARPSLLLTTV